MERNKDFDQLWEDVFGRSFGTQSSKYHSERNDDGHYLELPVPGLTKEDLSIKIIDSKLEIESTSNDHRWTPKFKQTFRLPKEIDSANTTAQVENGVLCITLGIKKDFQNVVKIL